MLCSQGRPSRHSTPVISLRTTPGATIHGYALQISVKTIQQRVTTLARTITPIQSCDALLMGRTLDFDISDVHMNDVGLNATLHHGRWQIDALGRQYLNQ